MANLNGQVIVNNEPTNNRLYRFCEKQIDHWMRKALAEAKGISPEALELAEFKVEFTDENEDQPGAKQISCVTEISVAGAHWKGCDLAADSQQAFMHTLKHMQLH